MLGERSDQRGLWEADRLYLDHVGRDTFYGLMASLRGRLFRDADFAAFYCPDNGRDSVPPSLLATAPRFLGGRLCCSSLTTRSATPRPRAERTSTSAGRACPRPRPGVALGIEVEDRPFAKSTLQVFRAHLILHDKVREVFESSLRLARESGYLKKRSMKVALDTTNILGRGAVRDTCNLLADGIVQLIRALAQLKGINHTEGQVFQYTIDLNRKKRSRKQPDWDEKKAPVRTIAKEHPVKLAPSRTPEDIAAAEEKSRVARREYDEKRNNSQDPREYHRRYAQEQRQKAKELGKCRDCSKPAISGQTRCPTCAENHRQSRRRNERQQKGDGE